MKIILFSLILSAVGLLSQQQVNRTAFPNALTQEYNSTSTLFPISAFWAEMQKGFGSVEEALSTNIRFGGLFEFYRWEETTLDFTLSFELTADPNNEIAFNPRSARWQEELFISKKEDWGIWNAGLMHRCKHEIDNFDPEDSTFGDPTYRVLLSSGPYFSVQNEYTFSKWKFHYLARTDLIIMKGDWRWEENTAEPHWDDLLAELSGAFLLEYKAGKYLNLYSRNWFNLMQFSESSEINLRAEIGTRFAQKTNNMLIYIAYENLYDDIITPFPRPSDVFYLGFRASHDLFW